MSTRGTLVHYIKLVVTRLAFKPATFKIGPERYPNSNRDHLLDTFINRCLAFPAPRVLELGTKRSEPGRSTLHRNYVPHAGEYLGTDIEPGVDVDIVADVHRLSSVVGIEQFDVIISCSTFEHIKYPHLAAHEVMKVLKIGGLLYIQTHQTFPLHAYPYDYFRFSREALSGLFGQSMGFRVIETDYEFPARIYAPEDPRAIHFDAFFNARLLGEKLKKTPLKYIYEFDN